MFAAEKAKTSLLEDFLNDSERVAFFKEMPENFIMGKDAMTYDLNMKNPLLNAFTKSKV